jgi:hypothetical protein
MLYLSSVDGGSWVEKDISRYRPITEFWEVERSETPIYELEANVRYDSDVQVTSGRLRLSGT